MGMADPRTWLYRMTCCGTFTGWLPAKEGGRWSGNDLVEVEKCPNPYCPSNRREPMPSGKIGAPPS